MPRNLRFEVPPGGVVLRGQDHYWSVILTLHRRGEAWTTGEIADRCAAPVNRGDICDFVARLVAGGFAAPDEGGEGRYRLLRTQLATPCLRRDGTPGEQGRVRTAMWNVLRGPLGRQGVTAQDLAFYASTESLTVKHLTARTYITHLSRAGLLRWAAPTRPASSKRACGRAERRPARCIAGSSPWTAQSTGSAATAAWRISTVTWFRSGAMPTRPRASSPP